MGKEYIEKGKWNVGDISFFAGSNHVCTGFSAATGRPTWKKIDKKNVGSSQQTKSDINKKDSEDENKQSDESDNKQPEVKTDAPKKQSSKYDAPTPKIQYKTKKPAEGVVFEVPETWIGTGKSGKNTDLHRDVHRRTFANMDENKLIKILNNQNNSPEVRQLAYEEAMARGIDEDRIDVSGSLQDKWDLIKEKNEMYKKDSDEDEDEFSMQTYDVYALRGMDPDKFVEENFSEGDDAWRSRDNDIIRKEFNGFKSLADRKRYDAFLDYMNRRDPYYRNPKQQMQGLNILFDTFIHDKSPLMVSSGGAGTGKTTGFLKTAKVNELERFDPEKHKPGDGNYDFFVVDKDIQSDTDFEKLLSEHNGKIIVFDDKDRLLTTNANKLVGLMKGIADGNPKMRVFKDPETGEQRKFTGKLLFLTNKNMDVLQKDDDHQAIMSRALKHDIRMTINENMELLRDRYKTIGKEEVEFEDPAEESYYREELWKFIKNNKSMLDPDKFTVRKFTEALKTIKGVIDTNKKAEENEDAAELFGGNRDWKIEVRQMLNKAVTYSDLEPEQSEYPFDKQDMLRKYRKNPKEFIEVFGEEFLEMLNRTPDKEKTEEEIEESFMNDIGIMSVEEAENILFG